MALITIECVVFGIFAANRYNLTKTETAKIEKLESDLAQTLEAVQKLRCELYGGFESVCSQDTHAVCTAGYEALRYV